MPWRGQLVAAIVLGACLAAGARASLASLRESSAPEGWSFARSDSPAARVIAAGPLRPSVHELGLSALQGITRTYDAPQSQVAVDAELPEGGVLEIRLGMGNLTAVRPTLVVVAGSDRERGGRVSASKEAWGTSLPCTPDVIGPISPGRHRFELHTGQREWLAMIDGAPVALCSAAMVTWRELTLTPGQFRLLLHTVEVSGAGAPISEAFAKGTYRWDVAVCALAVALAGGAVAGLVARGHRLVVACVALSPILLALPLSFADMRRAAARFRLLPDVAVVLPWLLPCFVALLMVAHLPSPGAAPPWSARIRGWLAGGGALLAAAALMRGGTQVAPSMLLAAVAGLLASRVAPAASVFERTLSMGSPLLALALAADAQWTGHLVGAGVVVSIASLTPLVGAAGRRASPRLLAALGATLLVALEAACWAGPQAKAWTSGTSYEAQALDPGGTSGQSHRAALLDSAATLERNCQVRSTTLPGRARRIAVFGGSSTTPSDLRDLPSYYPAVMERVWNQSVPTAPIQVLNQGAPGWTTNEISLCVERLAKDLTANLAIFYVGRNDTVGFGGVKPRSAADAEAPSQLATWLSASSLLRAAQFTMLGVMIDGGVSPAPPAVARANLAHAADQVRAGGGTSLLLSEATFPGSQTYAPYRRMLEELAESRDDVAYLDVATVLSEKLDPSLFEDEVHLTAEGHRVLGTMLAEHLYAHPELLPLAPAAGSAGPPRGRAPVGAGRRPGMGP